MIEHPWVKKLAIIFFIVWIVIGFIVLGCILYIFINRPQLPFLNGMMSNYSIPQSNSSQSSGASNTSGGMMNEKQLLQKYNSLTQDQKDCVKSEVGEERFNKIMSRTVTPTKDDLQKAESCIN